MPPSFDAAFGRRMGSGCQFRHQSPVSSKTISASPNEMPIYAFPQQSPRGKGGHGSPMSASPNETPKYAFPHQRILGKGKGGYGSISATSPASPKEMPRYAFPVQSSLGRSISAPFPASPNEVPSYAFPQQSLVGSITTPFSASANGTLSYVSPQQGTLVGSITAPMSASPNETPTLGKGKCGYGSISLPISPSANGTPSYVSPQQGTLGGGGSFTVPISASPNLSYVSPQQGTLVGSITAPISASPNETPIYAFPQQSFQGKGGYVSAPIPASPNEIPSYALPQQGCLGGSISTPIPASSKKTQWYGFQQSPRGKGTDRSMSVPMTSPRYAFPQQGPLGKGGSVKLPTGVGQQGPLGKGGSVKLPTGVGTDAGLEAVLVSAKAQGKTALCIWFHYLGGSGADWETGLKAKVAHQLPGVEWYFPDAPMNRMTCSSRNGSMERAWFDQLQPQITEGMATPGIEASVSYVHGLLRQAERHGFPCNRILLGGMSQGGVLAMVAGFSYARPLAGIIAVSAWVPPCLPGALRHPSTPLMIGNGDKDSVVPLALAKSGAKKLEQAGCSRIMKRAYLGKNHRWGARECEDVKQFIQSVISN